jgi:predicted nucleic acid-binding protein
MKEIDNYLATSFNKLLMLDTDVVIAYLRGDGSAVAFFDDYILSGVVTPMLSAISVSEIFMGARDKREESSLELWFSSLFDVVPVNAAISKEAGRIRRGRKVNMGDAIMAATSATEKVPLVTLNQLAYKGLNIKTYRPY